MEGWCCEVDVPEARWTAWRYEVVVLREEGVEEQGAMVVQWARMISLDCWR